MNVKNNLSIFNNLRPLTVGFDNMFDHFEHMLDDSFFSNGTAGNFPPYNIVKTGDHTYNIELALAGFNKKDIEVLSEHNQLTVDLKKKKLIILMTLVMLYTEVYLNVNSLDHLPFMIMLKLKALNLKMAYL